LILSRCGEGEIDDAITGQGAINVDDAGEGPGKTD
jgi:hypothetical protein